ncbi:hypothetical protein G6F47_012512 [Rhizopus delemar]|nr:hypothetical protein G6F47_012512 [Rhizopus delemar]
MVTRSKSSVSPSSSSLNESTVSPRRCPHCQLEGHVTTRARACLKNPIRLAENANFDHSAFQEDDFVREPIDKQPTDTVDIDMADDTFETRTACPLHERANIPAHNSNPITSSSLKIATMNCRGLRKSNDPSSSSQFIRYLRTHSLDILALQETHADTPQLQDLFHKQFQASDSLWSPHCGLVCFSPVLSFSNTVFSVCGRIITTTISHQSNIFDPVSVSVIYAPASRNARYVFFSNVLQGDFSSLPSNPSRHILLGDFNYSYASHLSPRSRRPQAPDHWLSHIHSYYVDGVTPSDQAALPTFHRGTQQSCIDYIFISRDLVSTQSLGRVHYIQPTWTDHFMVSLRIPLLTSASNNDTSAIGKGLWRAHPRLAADPAFCKLLTTSISRTIATFDDTVPVELRWDALKSTVKQTAQSFSRKSAFTLAKAETLLQKKRHGLLKKIEHDPECANVISPQLKIVEAQLTDIQQYHVETLALRAGIRWRELGELSPGYLKRTVATRSARQLIPPLLHPTHLTLSSTRDEMLDAASTFYKNLYSPQPVEQGAIDDLIGAIPEHLRLSEVDRSILVSPITYHDLLEGASRAPIRSSPGMDALH